MVKNILTAIALFFVLFFPQRLVSASPEGEILHSLSWRLPALILVLLLLEKSREEGTTLYSGPAFRPKRDFPVLGLALPALCLLGFLASFAAAHTGFPPPPVLLPSGVLAWAGVVLACLTTGYLEEAYFRVYLPVQCQGFGRFTGFWFPILLFSLCHVYEGPWGFANAFLAAVFLSVIYRKRLSFHGIALAHGLYNVFAYVMMSIKANPLG